ncbi:epsin-1 isoform X1 [Anarrhichthys ocellatus]|uniref:epsin-1 isoform X1 n=1 Tax=Anarrhichthys ocellatus TaxID=433405 RepID=UPI0012EE1C2C|nr:epsin-1-like isoform X1 [Anarrhichthys ocellatus]XP_031732360.1 epsin-1-like isoform X1 [Anarrhichthys ocellatus]XP_031732361.1 epsin-1-like isoform X1 [Anarrhichthys ocellatus]
MTSSMLRRQLKNLVQNYSEAEVKVREATSNDPWGPSSSQMADLSDLTYNVVACNEIMTMLWKRLKDDKNWRHIHKSLTLLEYLLKTGDDRVLLKMKDSIYIVKALTEYRFVEKDGKDQGGTVREKAKVVLVLMEDDDKLKEERDFAVKTREKTSKNAAASSADAIKDPSYKPCYVGGAAGLPSLDNIPSVADLTASFAARKEERLKQEVEKKEGERRAKLSEDELKWEDAGKGNDDKGGAWGGEKAEEEEEEKEKPEAWGAPKEPKEAAGPWGAPSKPDTTDAPASGDPWGAPTKADEDPFSAPKTDEDSFAAQKNGEDPFAAPKDEPDPFTASKGDPFNAPKDGSDPFNAPKDKEYPFAAPKDKPDPFNSSNNDPFNAPKDDPFKAPKDDPFKAPKDDPFHSPKDDPFNAPKDDLFNAPKDDPFNSPKDDPFNSLKDVPFNAPKDDPFNSPKDVPFNAPKDDPFNSPKDDPFNAPKDDPFKALKDDPFNAPKDDPFTAPASTPPKEDPFAALASSKDDSFTAATPPPKEDPFSASFKPTKEDPFAAPTTPPKEDPFTVPSSPPKDDASDPFNAPPVSSPQGSADAWGAPASSPPTDGADPWGAPSAQEETKGGDLWGDGTSAFSPVDNSDAFGDSSKLDNDPWGAPAAAPVSTDDAWGSPAPPSDSSPASDPFGDGASKTGDPWGAPSNASSNGTGKRTAQEEKAYRKTASFLGSAGASLVDLDDLFSSNPEPKQRSLPNTLVTQTQAIGAFKARGLTSVPVVRSGAVTGLSLPETSTPYCSPFGSTLAPSFGAPSYTFGAAKPSSESPLPSYSTRVSHSGLNMLQAAQVAPPCSGTGMVQSVSMGGSPQMGLSMNPSFGGLGMVQSGSLVGIPLTDPLLMGTGMGQSSFFGGNCQTGGAHLGGSTPQAGGRVPFQPQLLSGNGSGDTVNKNNNPFLF